MIRIEPDFIPTVLDDLTAQGASDIQFRTNQPPLICLHGLWKPMIEYAPLTATDIEAIHAKICRDDRWQTFPEHGPWDADYRTSSQTNNFRVSAGKEQGRLYLVLRPLPRETPTFEHLKTLDDLIGAPDRSSHIQGAFIRALSAKRGLVLVTGATGSGKSTTLAACVEYLNLHHHYNIITIEDPTEFTFRSKKSQVIQRETGVDTGSFSSALRAALRQKPNVILVGEMRDAETMEAAFRAASTGHLVLSTMHNNEVVQVIERITNEFPPEQQNRVKFQLSEVLVGVFAQQLLPTLTGGRQVVHEVMLLDQPTRALLRGEDYQQALRDALRVKNDVGNRLMDEEILRCYQEQLISEDVAMEFAINPMQLEKDLHKPQVNR
jgi:twitching motility protein PilT